MKKRNIIYLIVTLIFIVLSVIILSNTDMSNNVILSKSIQVILILFFGLYFYGINWIALLIRSMAK